MAGLVVAGFVASFIDSQVGGGGVITLPAYLLAGLPPHMALGTNKLGGTASALFASANYIHKKVVPWADVVGFAGLSLLGGAVGVWLALRDADGSYLLPVVLVVMAAMVAWVLLRPAFGTSEHSRPGHGWSMAMAAAALAIGIYDGILGPGTGSMLLVACVVLLGLSFRQASGLGRVLNLASNISALAYFIAVGQVDWSVGIPVAISMAIGGWVGSHANLKHGDRYLKPLFVTITTILMVVLGLRLAGIGWTEIVQALRGS